MVSGPAGPLMAVVVNVSAKFFMRDKANGFHSWRQFSVLPGAPEFQPSPTEAWQPSSVAFQLRHGLIKQSECRRKFAQPAFQQPSTPERSSQSSQPVKDVDADVRRRKREASSP